MSLSKHALRSAPQSGRHVEHRWIGDDLRPVLLHFTRLKRCKRNFSCVPGPLEARKRATKRRMVNVAPLAGSTIFDPSLLPGWGIRSRAEDLPATISGLFNPTQLPSNTHDVFSPPETQPSVNQWLPAWLQRQPEPPLQRHPHVYKPPRTFSPTAPERIYGASQVLNTPVGQPPESVPKIIRRSSPTTFQQLLETQTPTETLLGLLDNSDPRLTKSTNLRRLLVYETGSQVDFSAFKQRLFAISAWSRPRLALGELTEVDVHALALYAWRVGNKTRSEKLKCQIAEAIVDGLDSSSVLHFADIGPRTLVKLFDCLAQKPCGERSQALGLRIIGLLPEPLFRRLSSIISVFLLQSVRNLHPKSSSDKEKLDEGFASLLSALPDPLRLSTVRAMTTLLLNHSMKEKFQQRSRLSEAWRSLLVRHNLLSQLIHGDDGPIPPRLSSSQDVPVMAFLASNMDNYGLASLVLRQWCGASRKAMAQFEDLIANKSSNGLLGFLLASVDPNEVFMAPLVTRLFELLQALGRSEEIIKIVQSSRALDYYLPVHLVVSTVQNHLRTDPYCARRIFMSDPRPLIEQFPELAKHVILTTGLHPRTVWTYFRNNSHVCRKKAFRNDADRWRAARRNLLAGMAKAFSIRQYEMPSYSAFRSVLKCYAMHVREQLGPIGALISQSLIRVGFLLPLIRGEHLSPAPVAWILSVIDRKELEKLVSDSDVIVDEWLSDVATFLRAHGKDAEADQCMNGHMADEGKLHLSDAFQKYVRIPKAKSQCFYRV